MQSVTGGLLTSALRADPEYRQLLEAVRIQSKRTGREKLPLYVSGLCEGADDLLAVSLFEDLPDLRPVLFLCSEEKYCVALREKLASFGIRAGFFPGRDLNTRNITASHEFEHLRLALLLSLTGEDRPDAVITTPDAAVGITMPPELLDELTVRLSENDEISIDGLVRSLTRAGYVRSELAEGPGQFAVRGGILDVCYASSASASDERGGIRAVRTEFFGDEIDRVCLFDPDTQRITERISGFTIPPAFEVLPDPEKLGMIVECEKELLKKAKKKDIRLASLLEDEISAVSAAAASGGGINFADRYISLIYPGLPCLLDYLDDCPLAFVYGNAAVSDRLEASEKLLVADAEALTAAGLLPGKYSLLSAGKQRLDRFMSGRPQLLEDTVTRGLSGRRLGGMFNFRTRHSVGFGENTSLLLDEVLHLTGTGTKVILMTPGPEEAGRLRDTLNNDGEIARTADGPLGGDIPFSIISPGTVTLLPSAPVAPFELLTPRISVLSAAAATRAERAAAARPQRRSAKTQKGAGRILSFNDLSPGDYVVHETHGIGIYEGISTLSSGGMTGDYITIRYAGADRLFLPADQLDRVTKYIGAGIDNGTIKLSKFGGKEWESTRKRTHSSLKNIAKELIKLYAERLRRPGFAFSPDDSNQKEFEEGFEFAETEAQLEASEDIKKDMMRPVPMDRLLCGDVGYGKTEVAFRAAFKAILDGKQAAMLVPTTILALQHYQTAVSRMRAFPVTVEMISRFRKPAEQKKILERTARGDIDLLIGTHRILSKDVKFRDLGLLIVDEEQRFGVAQKEKIKQRTGNIDVLSLSATPIPRTMNMAMTGIRDISVLDEAPVDRQPVQTYVLEYDEVVVSEAIRAELRRGGQVFYLHNFIDSIDRIAADLGKEFPDARIAVAHGRMEKEEIEDIWRDMTEGSIDILVCTTIIESGIDLPNANTLIVTGAHRMGLSQLHQLRGRVGRSQRRAYAYFTFPKDMALTEIAEKRLEAIREYAEFGAGFRIAMRDLELRGAGAVLGAEQSGHMDAVGYELYVKLLNRAVLEEKGEYEPEKNECVISVKTVARIPEKYIESPGQRMAIYRRIAHITSRADAEDILDEVIDRYGDPPDEVLNLLDVSLIRYLAGKSGIERISQNGTEVILFQKELDLDTWQKLSEGMKGRIRIIRGSAPQIVMRIGREQDALAWLKLLFEKYRPGD
ncbi:MAG: transcription-repair coupling factor [Clostridiales bacterium]|nr:transcription-repair coupling factor [Clostridiales bacterium]